MDQNAAGSGSEVGGDREEDTAREPDDDGGGDCEYGGVSFVGAVVSYDGAVDPCGWGVCSFGPGAGECVKVMKALVCIKPGEFEYREMDAPIAGPGQSIIKIKRIGICGTDLHAF